MHKPIAFLLALLATNFCIAQNSIITYFAGNGTNAWTGDGGPATSAAVGDPYGIAIDNAGNVYIPDIVHNVVRKISTAGIITTVAGTGSGGYSGDGGPATAAMIAPGAVALDASGNLYIADGYNHAIRKVNTSGIITTVAGTGSSGYSGDGGPATAAMVGDVFGLTVDAAGNLYFSDDYINNDVRKVDASGIITTVAGNGTAGYSGDGGPATAAELNQPRGLAVDASGNLYIAEQVNARIRMVTPSGVISTFAGTGVAGYNGDGIPATAAQIFKPFYISFSNTGDLYITDVGNNRVRKINAAGIISTVAGHGVNTCSGVGGSALSASIQPVGVAIDAAQNVYFSQDSACDWIYKVQPAPTVSADSFSAYIDNRCNGVIITAVAHSSSSFSMSVSFGDNTTSTVAALASTTGGYEAATINHSYDAPGTYTIKMLLLNGSAHVDSATYSYTNLLCTTLPVRLYYDANSNCIKDDAESLNYFPVQVELDSNGVVLDTFYATSGFDYTAYGNPGDVYTFRVVSTPAGMYVSCPGGGGVITDTLQSVAYNPGIKYIGLSCSASSGFDLAEYVTTRAGRHLYSGDILVNNTYCNPQSATVTAQISPKYTFTDAVPAPASVVGNTVTWDLSGVAANAPQQYIHFNCSVPGTWLTPGDTANATYNVGPVTGDTQPGNNNCVKTDTVRSSYDPNEMSVTPSGYIPRGTTLQYTINFENTGNDTAYNIYVMDTLSDNVDIRSLQIVAASAMMNVVPLKTGSHNIMKFDFPHINLLDSSHHNLCNGVLVFNINAKTALPDGATIFNHAGIFFDDNPVVMTDTVEDMIPIPTNVAQFGNGGLQLYPNPTTGTLTISMTTGAYNTYTITNSIGQQLMQQSIGGTQATVNVQSLPAGVYYITLRGNDGSAVRKFVKM